MARPSGTKKFDARIRLNITNEQKELMRRLCAITGMGRSALYRAALEHYAKEFPALANKKRRAS